MNIGAAGFKGCVSLIHIVTHPDAQVAEDAFEDCPKFKGIQFEQTPNG
jgi:hypothetical protein